MTLLELASDARALLPTAGYLRVECSHTLFRGEPAVEYAVMWSPPMRAVRAVRAATPAGVLAALREHVRHGGSVDITIDAPAADDGAVRGAAAQTGDRC